MIKSNDLIAGKWAGEGGGGEQKRQCTGYTIKHRLALIRLFARIHMINDFSKIEADDFDDNPCPTLTKMSKINFTRRPGLFSTSFPGSSPSRPGGTAIR